jgi:hypothetical protein
MSINLLNVKPNVPTVSLDNYFWLISGIPKSGKTTLFAKLIEKYYGDVSKGLLLAFEKGYQALKVNAVDVNNFDEFEEIVNQLIEKKDQLPFKEIGIDTADILWDRAQEKVIEEWNIENPAKRTKDISGVGAKGKSDKGFGEGYSRAKKKIRDNIDKLMKAGYGIIALTHDKDKEIEQRDGLKYDQLVCSLPSSAREVFVNMADFHIFITIEKEKVNNEIQTKRYIYFRTDGYVEAGSRFKNVPTKIEYSIDELIKVFETAIKSELGENVNLDRLKEEEQIKKEQEAKKFIESLQSNKTVDELQQDIANVLKNKINNEGKNKTELEKYLMEKFGTANYTKLDDINILKEFLNAVKNY